ncbi:MAG: arginine decarboxylase, pyruvoyl-dependent [Candidatus Aminicenantes bacterium]|nr:MAG: arginine decarboxylase, pyruvoyl-dependent [Candidatus Aminicenantes bacterium]
MANIIPKRIFLTKGKGQHKEKLASFEQALREADIETFNLVKVSSIYPPGCRLISKQEGIKHLHPGQIVFLVMSENSTDESNRLISAAIGMAVPNDPKHYGYLSEHHSFGQDEKEAGQYAEDLAADMLATTLGKNFDLNQIWNEEKSLYELGNGMEVRTQNITQVAHGEKGFWTTVLAAAVLVP